MSRKLIPDRAARPLAATAAAALLAGIVITGYGASSAAAATTPGAATTTTSTAPASLADATTTSAGTLTTPSASGTCPAGPDGQWPGAQTLYLISYQLQQLADDQGLYGPGSMQVTNDDQAVSFQEYDLSPAMTLMPLPDPWTQAITNQVLFADISSQEQAQAAANAASSLAGQLSLLCYTPASAPTSPGLA